MLPLMYISYHDTDERYRIAITKHLAHAMKWKKLTVWDRTNIEPGQDISVSVSNVLKNASIAVLLISAEWWADERMSFERDAIMRAAFIENRLIPLLFFVRKEISSAIEFDLITDQNEIITVKLTNHRGLNDHRVPLAVLSEAQQESALADAAEEIINIAQKIGEQTDLKHTKQTTLEYLIDNFKEISDVNGRAISIMVTPRYEDDKVRQIAKRLCSLRAMRTMLSTNGTNIGEIEAITEQINFAKLELRQSRLRAGDFLRDNYRLIHNIGFGGFGSVWQAFDLKSHSDVAIKLLHNDLITSMEHQSRFRCGAKAMKTLKHPNIMSVISDCEENDSDEGIIFYVMKYAPGGDLYRKICDKSISEQQMMNIILKVGKAISYAHEMGIIHRDVKPHNILLESDGNPLLTDFDLIRTDARGLTITNAMVGAPLYTDPESLTDDIDMNPKIDIYSLAVTTIEALSERSLSGQALFDRFRDSIDSLTVNESTKSVLTRAVAKQDARFSTMADFCDSLNRAYNERTQHAGIGSPSDLLRKISASVGIILGAILPILLLFCFYGTRYLGSYTRLGSFIAPTVMFILYTTWVLHFPHRETDTAEMVTVSTLLRWLIRMEWRAPARLKGHYSRRISYPLASTSALVIYYVWPVSINRLGQGGLVTISSVMLWSAAIMTAAIITPLALMWIARLSFPILPLVFSILTGGVLMAGGISESGIILPHIGRMQEFLKYISLSTWILIVVMTLMLGLYAIRNFGPANRACQGRLLFSLIIFVFWEIFLLFAILV